MIYILSGVAKSGKSLVAEKILKERAVSRFSTDYLMMSLARANPSLGVEPEGDDALVAEQLKPYLHMMIKTMIENHETYLFEGVHFNPPFAKELLREFPNDIRIVYLGFIEADTDEKISELRMHSNKIGNNWYKHFSDLEMRKLIDYLKEVSAGLKQECVSYGIPYIEVTNIAMQADDIIHTLMDS